MKRGPFVKFEQQPTTDKRVTKAWRVVTIADGTHLGNIGWFSPWRKYCFGPVSQSWFDADCLWDIADFVSRETRLQKEVATRKRHAKAVVQ